MIKESEVKYKMILSSPEARLMSSYVKKNKKTKQLNKVVQYLKENGLY